MCADREYDWLAVPFWSSGGSWGTHTPCIAPKQLTHQGNIKIGSAEAPRLGVLWKV